MKIIGMMGTGVMAILAWICAMCLMTTLVGCTTTKVVTTGTDGTVVTNTVKTLDTNAVIESIGVIVPSAVSIACASDTNAIAYFQQAALMLKLLADTGTVDYATVSNSLSTISVKEIRNNQQAIIAEVTIMAIYKAAVAKVVDGQLDKVTWLRPVLAALAQAIQDGIPVNGTTSKSGTLDFYTGITTSVSNYSIMCKGL